MSEPSILVAEALGDLKQALRQTVSVDQLPDSVLEPFAAEFVADMSRILAAGRAKWDKVRPGLLARARALGALAAVYAHDEGTTVTVDHLRMALGIVKERCTALAVRKDADDEVLERWRLWYEGCRSVPTK